MPQAGKAAVHGPCDRRGARAGTRPPQPEQSCLQREAPEDAAPEAELNEETAEQWPEQRARRPDQRLDAEQAAPQMLREPLLDGDVAQASSVPPPRPCTSRAARSTAMSGASAAATQPTP